MYKSYCKINITEQWLSTFTALESNGKLKKKPDTLKTNKQTLEIVFNLFWMKAGHFESLR